MSRFITRFHWTFLTKINLMTYLLYMFILYTYILSTNECWILKMLNISVIWYLLFIPFLLLISLHLYYMCTLSTLYFKLFKGYSIHLKKKEITDNFYLSVLPAPYMLLICTLITTDKMSTKYVQVYMYINDSVFKSVFYETCTKVNREIK